MKTLIFNAVESLEFIETEIPRPKSNEILIKIDTCAICTWEQRVYKGLKEVPFPFVGGHEIAGRIVELGSDVSTKNWNIGDSVVYGTNLACGDCYQCRVGNEQNCEHFDHTKKIPSTDFIGMGGFSEYLVVDPRRLFKFDTKLPAEYACLTEPVSCCIHSVNSADVQFGEKVLVFGCGIMGQIHIQLALKRGAYVVAVDMNQDRLDIAKACGAHDVINNSEMNLAEQAHALTNGHGFDAIFNTTPIAPLITQLDDVLAINGRHVLYSSFYPDGDVNISADRLHKKATKLIGTANSNSRDFMQAINLLENEILDIKPYMSKVFDFEDYEEAFQNALDPKNFRIVLQISKD